MRYAAMGSRVHALAVWLTIIALLAGLLAPAGAVQAGDEAPPAPPLGRPRVAAGVLAGDQVPVLPGGGTTPAVPHPIMHEPTEIYNNLLIPTAPDRPGNMPQPAMEAAAAVATDRVWEGKVISSTVTNLANGARLTYANIPNDKKPHPCVDFNKKNEWASQTDAGSAPQVGAWNDYYAGWTYFTVDEIEDDGFYRAQNVVSSFDESVGNVISARLSGNHPYGAWYESPPIPVKLNDQIEVVVRYLLGNIPPEMPAVDWVSLGIRPSASGEDAVYANGYVRGTWTELRRTAVAKGGQIVVTLQAHSPAAIDSNVWFDDVEIFVNGTAVPDCAYQESFSAK